jgi:hypothetical protein
MKNDAAKLICIGASSLVVAMCGCSLYFSPLAKQTAAFGNAAAVVVRDSSDAYDTVERVTYDAGVSSLVLDFDSKGFNRKRFKPFLPEHDLEVRKTLLAALSTYAQNLADIAGDQAFGPLDEQTKSLSDSLVTLSGNGELKKIAPSLNESEAKGLAAAVDTLAKVLIEHKRRRQLPATLHKMQPVIEQVCSLLAEDIGNPHIDGRRGRGLRDQLWNEYDMLIDNQTDFISGYSNKFTPEEKAAEIAKLPKLVVEQQSADAALASTQSALRDLVEAHKALLTSKQTGTFHERLDELIKDGQNINAFYSSLNSK